MNKLTNIVELFGFPMVGLTTEYVQNKKGAPTRDTSTFTIIAYFTQDCNRLLGICRISAI